MPIPPEALMVPLCLQNPRLSVFYALAGTAASAAGGLFGYFIGKKVGQPILHFFAPKLEQKLDGIFQKYGAWAVFMVSLAPADYKIFTIASGLFDLKLTKFLLAAISGRGLRYLTVAILVMVVGKHAVGFLKHNYIWVSISFLVVLLIAFVIYRRMHRDS
ncbi:MAG TPA: VTT domain-containing protein [Syntrophomonadaceae bacterium]|nr:VTT domain-containing protein [Syntrophomonadaceae bacterium]